MASFTSTQASQTGYVDTARTPERSVRARYADNVYFQDGLLLTGVLTSLLYLIVATSLDAAGYVSNMGLLLPVTLGALALGFFMSFSRFDGFFALSHSMFTGLAWILFLMSGMVTRDEIAPFLANGIPEVQASAYFVLLRWLNWIDAAINNIASNDNYIFIFEMSFLVWWLTYLGIWSIFRYGYTWRAIVPAGAVLLVNTYYAPQSILGFLVVFCLLAMLIFVRTNLAEQQLRWREQRVHFSPDVTFDFLRNGLTYSAVVVALAWLVPGLGRSLEVRAVLAPLNQQWEETTVRMNRLYQGINRQTVASASGFGRSLALGGARNVGNNLVFYVDAPQGRYWRAVVYDTYTGRQWLNTGEDDLNLAADEAAPIPAWDYRRPLTQTITMNAPSGGMIFAAPDIISADLPLAAGVRPLPALTASGEPAYEITTARATRALDPGDRYTVISSYVQVTERALNEAGDDYPDDIRALYLQLPDDFSLRIATDAETLTATRPTAYSKARAIETYLRGFTYNEDIDAPPDNRDPVEYFLYDIREGYCDYYASAMVVMLRSLGIPSRVVSGYAEGTYDDETRLYYISERDAHTWVEVYFPGLGWIEFEPTAGESQLNRPSGADDFFSDPFEDMYNEFYEPGDLPQQGLGDEFRNNAESELFQDQFTGAGDLSAERSSRMWWAWALITPLLLVLGGWLIWRTRISGPTGFDPDLPPILFARLQRWTMRLGLTPPVGDTPYEQAGRWSTALPEGSVPINTITEEYVRYRFSRGHAAAGDRQALPDQWRILRPLLWRSWLRRLVGLRPSGNGDHFDLVEAKASRPGNGRNDVS